MKKYISLFLALLTVLGLSFTEAFADCNDNSKYKGKIINTKEIECEGVEDEVCIEYEIEILDGERKGDTVATTPISTAFGYAMYSVGDKVYTSGICGADGETIWGIENYSRESSVIALLVIFVIVVFIVSGTKGLGSLFGLAVSFLIIYFVMVPMSIKTGNVLLWGILSVLAVLSISIYLSHGFNKKSNIALLCTLLGIAIISILSLIFISSTKLTGFGDEEVYMLLSQLGGNIDVKQILFLTMLISGIGVLDDVTVSQVGTVIEIAKANPRMKSYDLYKSSMNVGKDHVSSMVNTLFIAYAGSSLSLIMLMNANGTTWGEILNSEFFAEEIVRATVSSMGLVLVVPISAFLGSIFVPKLIKEGKL